eukprot:gene13011-biopygen73
MPNPSSLVGTVRRAVTWDAGPVGSSGRRRHEPGSRFVLSMESRPRQKQEVQKRCPLDIPGMRCPLYFDRTRIPVPVRPICHALRERPAQAGAFPEGKARTYSRRGDRRNGIQIEDSNGRESTMQVDIVSGHRSEDDSLAKQRSSSAPPPRGPVP